MQVIKAIWQFAKGLLFGFFGLVFCILIMKILAPSIGGFFALVLLFGALGSLLFRSERVFWAGTSVGCWAPVIFMILTDLTARDF